MFFRKDSYPVSYVKYYFHKEHFHIKAAQRPCSQCRAEATSRYTALGCLKLFQEHCTSPPSHLNKINDFFFSVADIFCQVLGQLADIVNRMCFNRIVKKIYGCCNIKHSGHRTVFKTLVHLFIYFCCSCLEISQFGKFSPLSVFGIWNCL